MDDSDDYFTDDLVLDDQTLAALDQEEQRFLSQAIPPPQDVPVHKKQKINNGWKPGLGNRVPSFEEVDDLPEIYVQGDGTYNVSGVSRTHAGPSNISGPSALSRNPAAQNYLPAHTPRMSTRPNILGQQVTPQAISGVSSPSSRPQLLQRHLSQHRNSRTPPVRTTSQIVQSSSTNTATGTNSPSYTDQMAILQQKLEEVGN